MAEYVNPRAQSCQNCVKAKAKCYGHTDGTCERCNRMRRECVMQVPIVRKRKAGKTSHEAQSGRIVELEGRLNDLVSRLPLPLSAEHTSPVFTPESTNTLSSGLSTFPNQGNPSAEGAADTQPDHGTGFGSTSSASDLPRSTSNADELLDVFRQKLARQVPFIFVPGQMSALTLYRERPFLYQAIITVASYHDSVHQIDLGHQFLKHLTEHLVLQGHKNLDMLQGLLVYITWYNGLFSARSQLTTLLGFAFTLLIDLHLYLPMARFEKHEKFLDEMKGVFTSCSHVAWARKAEPSREEKRTLLGCFYIFTCVSTAFCRYNPLQWTSYIQDCYDDISNAPENENDIYLGQLSTLQRISEGVRQSGLRSFPSQPRVWNAATGVHFKLLLSELQRFKGSLPKNLQQDAIILMHYHAIEMYLFEIGFYMHPTALTDTPTLQRAEILLMCHHATRTFSDIYFSIDFDSAPFINFSPVFISQIYFVMMTLSKLSLFDADDWDATNVQTTLDLSTVLDLAVTMTEAASARYDLRDDDKPWLQVTRKMRQVKVRFERLLANENRDLVAAVPGTQIQGDATNMSMPLFLEQFDLLDDRFWDNLPNDTFIA
ncbi:Transcriptional regulator [Lachnellula subtilissima]|uniref:Transcriptional regulator n=1 Tax=Lachnellula subtilissima TaxID=602034 RepID=A0A8H8U9X4_9HELO|nr:Transcriptional regulator [Lachnellula subtilissima]